MNFSPFGGPFPTSIPGIHQFAASQALGTSNNHVSCSLFCHNFAISNKCARLITGLIKSLCEQWFNISKSSECVTLQSSQYSTFIEISH